VFLYQTWKLLAHNGSPGAPEDVTDEKNTHESDVITQNWAVREPVGQS
jgi:hypothetical protein